MEKRGASVTTVSSLLTDGWEKNFYEAMQGVAERMLQQSDAKIEFDAPALVHEAWLRIQRHSNLDFADASHAKAIGARMMHRVLIDYLRRRQTEKKVLVLTGTMAERTGHRTTILALSHALQRLQSIDETQYEIVSRRALGGMTMSEIAASMERPLRTIEREWSIAKAWLLEQLMGQETTG